MTGPGADRRPDDATLVRAVAEGSHEALATLYDRYGDGIYAVARRLTPDRGMAEEVVQETFLVLWDRAPTYDPAVGSLPAWLNTIARNRTVDRLRAAGRRPDLTPLSAVGGGGGQGPGGDPDPDALERVLAAGHLVAGSTPGRSPEASAELTELRGALQAALAAMPADERAVILLAYGEDLSQSEIAARLDQPLGTVKTRTRRALARLRQVFETGVGPEMARYLAPVRMPAPDDGPGERS
jgi:RNA polymerase sigma-70 factor, ECF subfamily